MAIAEVEQMPEYMAIQSRSRPIPPILSIEEVEELSEDDLETATATGLIFFDPTKP
jgi:hypothetical protein